METTVKLLLLFKKWGLMHHKVEGKRSAWQQQQQLRDD